MKQFVLMIAIVLGVAVNSAVADNSKPVTEKPIEITHNGLSLIKVSINSDAGGVYEVNIYDHDFALLHVEQLKKVTYKYFDISKLGRGFYIIKVERDGEPIHTQVVQKAKETLVADM